MEQQVCPFENKSCYIKRLAVHGILKIGDLISDNGRFLESEKLLQARLSLVHFFKLMGNDNSIPNEWKLIIKQSQQHICPPSNDTFQIHRKRYGSSFDSYFENALQ